MSALPLPTSASPKADLFANCTRRDFEGHKKKIHALDWNCTGNKLASGSMDRALRVWSVDNSGKPPADLELKGHTEAVESICWSPKDPAVLASASGDKHCKIWDIRSGKATHSFDTKSPNIYVAWSPTDTIAVGNKKDILTFIDTRTWKQVATKDFGYEINEVAWHRSGGVYAVSSRQGCAELYTFPDNQLLTKIEAHTTQVYSVEFDPSGKLLATGGGDAFVSLWDLEELVCVRTINRLDSSIRTLSFSHDSSLIASASEEPCIDISSVETGELVHSVRASGEVFAVAWNPKQLLLAFAGEERPKGRDGAVVAVFGFPA